MEPSHEVLARKKALLKELETDIAASYRYANMHHQISGCLMLVALGCSVGAFVGGVWGRVDGKTLGGLAGLSPLIAFLAVNLKLEAKSSWYFRINDAFSSLRSRLEYQIPEIPTVEDVAMIAKDRENVKSAMQKEWDRGLAFDWSVFEKGHSARKK
jgi:hypothetical protein